MSNLTVSAVQVLPMSSPVSVTPAASRGDVARLAADEPISGARAADPLDPRQVATSAEDDLRTAIAELNQQLESSGRQLGFAVDPVLKRPIITVRSSDTGEVIRQIPSEAVLRVAHTFEALKGLVHDATS